MIRRHYFVGLVPPARHAARCGSWDGWGCSLSVVRRCACGYEARFKRDFEAHLAWGNRLADALEEPALPGVMLEPDDPPVDGSNPV